MASELLITKLAMKGIIGYLLITLHFLPKGKKKVPKLFVTYPWVTLKLQKVIAKRLECMLSYFGQDI